MEERLQLRELRGADVAEALEISAAAGWNQTADDWRMLIELSPGGCLGIEVGDRLAATATLLCYGRRLAWVGMVLTRVEFRGRGFARRLLTCVLERADALGVESVKLDATEEGQPLYEKLGFRAEQPIERWARCGSGELAETFMSTSSESAGQCSDFEAFGADRSALLQKLADREAPSQSTRGFAYSRPGRVAATLGPCIATDETTARVLIKQRLGEIGESDCFWDILTANDKAVAMAASLGFAPTRRLLRMVRGQTCRGKEQLIYATAGFELG